MASVNERLARIETLCEGTDKKITTLYDLHNDRIAPAVVKIGVLGEEFKEHKKSHWQVALAVPTIICCVLALLTYFSNKGGRYEHNSKITAGVESK